MYVRMFVRVYIVPMYGCMCVRFSYVRMYVRMFVRTYVRTYVGI